MFSKRCIGSFVAAAVVVAAVMSAPAVARAQSAERPVGVGAKAAWHLNRVRGAATNDDDLPIEFGTGNGFSVGGLLAIDAGPNVTIQPEFLYSQKSFKADVVSDGVVGIGEIDTDWFEVPVLVKLHGERRSGPRPFALVGATISVLVNARQSLTALGMTITDDIKDELVGTDFGVSFGGGVDFLQSWGVFTIDARYTLGLRSLSDEDEVKQDTFAISGGFIF